MPQSESEIIPITLTLQGEVNLSKLPELIDTVGALGVRMSAKLDIGEVLLPPTSVTKRDLAQFAYSRQGEDYNAGVITRIWNSLLNRQGNLPTKLVESVADEPATAAIELDSFRETVSFISRKDGKIPGIGKKSLRLLRSFIEEFAPSDKDL